MKNPFETQQTRARKEFKALGRAQKNDISEAELVQEMTKDMAKPDSAEAMMQAASAVMYMSAVKSGDTPITDAVNRCLAKKRKEKASTGLVPNPA
ncbi:hypothetical protein PS925_04436 [Pseudomonas fluorescens]|uniref:Uncharacterized protein n=1 Tax=Pseudomonas fluorescens TaxID=294 RepID=A0A5E7VE81_PSEFL|nr:hypothetical protein [Pseudomonas fluorescens]VVQ18404.1 hypothetical protein PS925_04436 [Pseudomonas fluorescens]